jgi:hypothetical protein
MPTAWLAGRSSKDQEHLTGEKENWVCKGIENTQECAGTQAVDANDWCQAGCDPSTQPHYRLVQCPLSVHIWPSQVQFNVITVENLVVLLTGHHFSTESNNGLFLSRINYKTRCWCSRKYEVHYCHNVLTPICAINSIQLVQMLSMWLKPKNLLWNCMVIQLLLQNDNVLQFCTQEKVNLGTTSEDQGVTLPSYLDKCRFL